MLALFLNHPPIFVAGEIALSLSLALFLGALITAIADGASKVSGIRIQRLFGGLRAQRSTLVRMSVLLWQRGRWFDRPRSAPFYFDAGSRDYSRLARDLNPGYA